MFLKILEEIYVFNWTGGRDVPDCPISTLRYYDKQGLFRTWNGYPASANSVTRRLEALRVIECLKKAGMEIKDIRQFMDWC